MRWRAWGIGLVGSKIRSILGINKIIRKNVSAERQGVMFGLNLTRRGGGKKLVHQLNQILAVWASALLLEPPQPPGFVDEDLFQFQDRLVTPRCC
jgi:hypothetical protein